MNIQELVKEILVLACGGSIVVLVAYTLFKHDLRRISGSVKEYPGSDSQLLMLRLQAHERLVLFIHRINPASLFLRLHQAGMSIQELQSLVLEQVRSEYQHNVAQQLYVSPEIWTVVSKLKEDTLAMVANGVRSLPADADGVDLARKVLMHVSELDADPYELTISIIKMDIHQLR